MDNQTSIEKLITSGKKVFTTDDLAVIWEISNRQKLLGRVKYYLRKKRLTHIHKGVYAYGEYTPLEAAQKIVPLSYVSLYTASQMHGLTFQYYSTIFCMSLKSKKYDIGGQKYEYRKIKEAVFYDSLGLTNKTGYTLAGKERTICDLLYVFPGFAFDNLKGVDTVLLRKISRIYGNKRLRREVAELVKYIESER
jgi:predicted transcriptional regulator of viral defense system